MIIIKQFILKIDDTVVVASNSKWLIKLYLVQRYLDNEEYEIIKSKDIVDYDIYLIYYFGFAITTREMDFVYLNYNRKKIKMKKIEEIINTILHSPKDVEEYLTNYSSYHSALRND